MKSAVFRVCLLGCSFETGNFGVAALAASLVSITQRTNPNAKITLLIPNKVDTERTIYVAGAPITVKSVAYRRSPLSSFDKNVFAITALSWLALIPFLRSWAVARSPILALLDSADFIGDIHGGDSFSDIYGLRRFKRGCQPLHWIRRLGKPLCMLPQTYGPFKSSGANKLAKQILCYARTLRARDRESQALALSLSGKDSVAVIPDVAFCLEPISRSDGYPEAIFADPTKPLIGLNVSGLLFSGGYTRDNMFGLKLDYAAFSRRLAARLLSETDCNILLVPHTVSAPAAVEDDRTACYAVREAVRNGNEGRVRVSDGDYDQSELKSLIGRCSFFIGGRMHACIAALSQGIPTVGVAYSKKFRGVFETAGRSEWVLPAMELDESAALDFVFERIESSKAAHVELSSQMETLRSIIYADFAELMGGRGAV